MFPEVDESKASTIAGDLVSTTMVLRSNAGYYIGRLYKDKEFGAWLPYDRLSTYFNLHEEAEKALHSSI